MASDSKYPPDSAARTLVLKEQDIEDHFITKLRDLKYTHRPDIRDRAALEKNFREKFENLNRVRLTDGEFSRLLDELITPDVSTAARVIREKNDFTRDDGTPLAQLFDVSTDNVGLHLKNVYEDGELRREATTEDSSVVQTEGGTGGSTDDHALQSRCHSSRWLSRAVAARGAVPWVRLMSRRDDSRFCA